MRKSLIMISVISMMFILMSSFAFAGIEVLSSSQITFVQSGSVVGDKSFRMLVAETGGSEKIPFSSLKPTGDFQLESSSGYISGQSSNVYVNYPFSARDSNGEIWNIIKLNGGDSKFFWGWASAQDWCIEQSKSENVDYAPGSRYQVFAGKSGTGTVAGFGDYYCYAPNKVGTINDIGGYQYQWTETFSIWNPLEGDLQTITLSNQDREGSLEYSPNRKIVAKWSLNTLGINSYIPNLGSDYSVFQQDSFNTIIENVKITDVENYQSGTVMDEFLKEFLGANTYQSVFVEGNIGFAKYVQQNGEFVRGEIDKRIKELITAREISDSGWESEFDTVNGNIKLTRDDGDFPISPVFTLDIDAEWVGVFQPKGKPVLESFEVVEEEYIEGDVNAKFKSVVRNDGEDSSFSYILDCNPSTVTIDAVSTQYFPEGDERVLYHDVRSQTTGEDIKSNCCLTVRDRNNPEVISEQKCDIVTFIERNTCPDGMLEGSQSCSISGAIMQCVENTDGRLVLKPTAIVCENGCSLNGNYATCDTAPGCDSEYEPGRNSTDGICESFEEIGERCQSYEDCTTIGDGYCSAKERELGTDPNSCNAKESTDTWIYVIFGIVAGGLILGAIFLRLKKDGFFK